MDAALSPDALMVLRSMLAVLLGLVMSEVQFETFSAVRNLVQEALPDEAKAPIVEPSGQGLTRL